MLTRSLPKSLLALALCLILVQGAAWSTEPPRYVGFTILYTNDIHGHLFPLDYYDNDYNGANIHLRDVGGAARQATLIRQFKSTSPYPVIVMSAGDVFTRGPIADLHGEPDIDVMNAIPYDVLVLGNNEFKGSEDNGQQILFDRIKQAHFPVLSANLLYKSTGETIVSPYKIFDINGARIGVFGLTTHGVAGYSTAQGLDVLDPISVAKTMVAELREKADFIVALTHIGYDYGKSTCDLQLAAQVPDIDVIIGGHSHTWLSQPTIVPHGNGTDSGLYVDGTIVNQAGEWGVVVGEIDLRLRLTEGNRYRVMSYSAKNIDVDSTYAPAADVEALLERHTEPLREVIGTLNKEIPKPNMGNWLAACIRETAGTQIGMAFGSTIEDSLRAGPVTRLDLRRSIPAEQKLLKGAATGKELKDYLADNRPILSGAKVLDGELFVGDEKAVDTQVYSIAAQDCWDMLRSELGKTKLSPTDLTIWDVVARHLNRAAD